jgi:HAD superfamily hydrolase (TIGR01509 family)
VGAAPGAHDALAVLAARRLPWGVVTSADRRLAGLRLAAAGIEPPLLVTVEDTARGKPHPDGYLKAAAALGADPVGCLVVEDSEPGIAAGRAAGMPVAALRGLPADLPIADLRALAGWLDGAR